MRSTFRVSLALFSLGCAQATRDGRVETNGGGTGESGGAPGGSATGGGAGSGGRSAGGGGTPAEPDAAAPGTVIAADSSAGAPAPDAQPPRPPASSGNTVCINADGPGSADGKDTYDLLESVLGTN